MFALSDRRRTRPSGVEPLNQRADAQTAPFRAGATHAVHFRPVAVAYVQDQVVSDGGEVSNRLRRPAGKSADRRGRSDRQRASIPGGRLAGAAIAPGLARKSADPRLSIADSFPDLARGDARLADRGIRSLRSSTPRRSRCGRRRTPVQHVVIRMIKFECPRSWIAAWETQVLQPKQKELPPLRQSCI